MKQNENNSIIPEAMEGRDSVIIVDGEAPESSDEGRLVRNEIDHANTPELFNFFRYRILFPVRHPHSAGPGSFRVGRIVHVQVDRQ